MPVHDSQKLKQEYGWFYDALCRLLAEDDPIGLIAGGAPVNEYDIEADEILCRLHDASSPAALGNIICEVFIEYFRSPSDPPEPPSEGAKKYYRVLGERAWTIWTRWKAEA
jgi:hypothetical protein